MAENTVSLFGFEIKRKKEGNKEAERIKSVVAPQSDDGAGYVTASGSHFGQYIDIDGDNTKDNIAMINKYRGISIHPEVDMAIEDIVNEAIVNNAEEDTLSLNTDGIAAIQGITIRDDLFDRYKSSEDFIQKYIFPGGFLPSMHFMKNLMKKNKLNLLKVNSYPDDYAKTLAIWRENFFKTWDNITPLGFDETFKRMWEFYLSYCEAGFKARNINLIQCAMSNK